MKTKFIKNITLLLLVFMTQLCFSQQKTVSGTVYSQNAELPGVAIIIKGTKKGTQTDIDGKYSLKVKKGDVLIFRFHGMKTVQKKVGDTTLINVNMSMDTVGLEEVVLVGSRSKNRTVVQTPVPIDVIDVKELTSAGAQTNLNQLLNYVAPSFSSNTQTISDGTDHVDPASLRGLGPDQVLVLINGKRRHTSSLVNVNGTFGRGNVGTDLNAIPTAAIKRLEVLRDGASAQYGSDAIAGVINIVLKDNVDELSFSVTSGANVSKNSNDQTGGMDGETVNVSANYGIKLGEKGGFINFTGDFDYRDPYSRMKQYQGAIFNAYNSIEWQANKQGKDIGNLSLGDIKDAARQINYFSATQKSSIESAGSLDDLRNILKFDTTESELLERGQNRSDYNMRVGQAKLRGGRFFANLSIPFDDKGTEFYSFAGVSSRDGNSAGFYRLPNQERTYTPLQINGFLPEINSKIKDQSIAVGIRGKIKNWSIDFSNTWGRNSFDFKISNSLNASMLNSSPTTFDAGGFAFSQNTTNLDISRSYPEVFKGVNVAFGAEHRLENYQIFAGQPESYQQYDDKGQAITTTTEPTKDFFGRIRPAGVQVFPGFRPRNELDRQRSSFASYADVEFDFTEKLLVNTAVRFENYSDFGSTLNFKIASRYKLGNNFNLRVAANTGFRAPSLHQSYFNSISTQFAAGLPSEVGTFSNDSEIAKKLGIPKLKQEESQSISLGLTAKMPDLGLTMTADAYFVAIENRIVLTDSFKIPKNIPSNVKYALFFANAIDTESKGVDFVITHKLAMGSETVLKSDLSATLSQTKRVGEINSSKVLKDSGQEGRYFSETSRIYLEESVPRTKINLSNNLSVGRFNFFLRNVYFGSVTEAISNSKYQQKYDPKIVTDLSAQFKANENLTFTLGANNIFDIYPDKIKSDNPNYSSGRFEWSRRAQQFGIGGRFLFVRLNFVL